MSKFKIDRVSIMTLEYRKDRQMVSSVVCALADVPYDRFELVFGRCGNDRLPDTVAKLAEKIVADGFTEWEFYLENETSKKLTHLAADWSKLSLLRRIANGNENVLFVADTCLFSHSFRFFKFEESLSKLECGVGAVFLGNIYSSGSKFHENEGTIDLSKTTAVGDIYSGVYLPVVPSVVFTPVGARTFLDIWRTVPECLFSYVPYVSREMIDMRDFYFCFPKKWLHIGSSSGYPFSRSDMEGVGVFYDSYEEGFRL